MFSSSNKRLSWAGLAAVCALSLVMLVISINVYQVSGNPVSSGDNLTAPQQVPYVRADGSLVMVDWNSRLYVDGAWVVHVPDTDPGILHFQVWSLPTIIGVAVQLLITGGVTLTAFLSWIWPEKEKWKPLAQ